MHLKYYGSSFTHLVEVPLRTSHMSHLKASGGFLNVQTEQSQKPSVSDTLLRFDLQQNKIVVTEPGNVFCLCKIMPIGQTICP